MSKRNKIALIYGGLITLLAVDRFLSYQYSLEPTDFTFILLVLCCVNSIEQRDKS